MLKQLNISNRAFWDIDLTQLDVQRHDAFLVSRVFNYGKWNDILSVIRFYGEKKVLSLLTNTDYLTESALHLASTIFNVNKNQFKCFTNKQYPHSYSKP